MYETDDSKFWENYAQNDYLDIFYIRTKVWRGSIKARQPVDARAEAMKKANKFPDNKNMIYFNIPFCASRCSYCLYYTKLYDKAHLDGYLSALSKEVESVSNTEYINSTNFEYVYFGGGTPSLLEEDQIDKVADIVYKNFKFTNDLEISFEVNPASITADKIKALKRNNFNRVSLGIQSLNDKYLKQMNCKHNSKEAKEIITRFLDEGFAVNIDLIYGFEGQTEEEVKSDFEEVLRLKKVHHVSAFPLKLVTQTPLYNQMQKKQTINVASHNNKLISLQFYISEFLKENGYACEEESVHFYREDFHPHRYQSLDGRIIGFGAGAGTLMDNVESGNIIDVAEYMEHVNSGKSPIFTDSILTDEQTYERFILYRLLYMNRSLPNLKGLIGSRFQEFFNIPMDGRYEAVTDHMLRKKLIQMDGDSVIFTERFHNVLKNFRFGAPSII